jgi:hypothetical protein
MYRGDTPSSGRRFADHAGKVALRILIDFLCGKKREVEIARGEAEGAAVIVAEDVDVGGVAVNTLGPSDAGEAVIVGGDRHRPVAGNGIIVGEQLAGTARCRERIIALVDHVIDAHETPAGTSRELPDTGRTHV